MVLYVKETNTRLEQPSFLPWRKWIYTIIIGLFTIPFVLLGQYVSQYDGTRYSYQKPPLYDVVHQYLPDLSNYWWIMWILLAVSVLRFFSLKRTTVETQEYIIVTCIALCARAVSIMVTSQPSCIPSCQTNPGQWPFNTCFDFLFSGHTVCIVTASCAIIKDSNSKRIEKVFWLIYMPLSALFITMCRQHYTCDVFLGLLIGFLLSTLSNLSVVPTSVL